ncbi:MAG: prepilin-type N-terminal cleavage/methylation domain-containing protein [Pseudomonadota bacterium]
MFKKSKLGFSLIELMIVVGIMGILSAIAFPCYQNYTTRARFAEIISATEPFKLAVAIALQTGAELTELNSGKPGLPASPSPSKNLASIEVKNGVITATGTQLVNNNTYVLQPDKNGSSWSVGGTCVINGTCNA